MLTHLYEITQSQWRALLGTIPWTGKLEVMEGPDYPAVYVSWDDTQLFVQQLNATVGDSLFRLPTEAEWEYACRANTTTPWWFGCDAAKLEEYAWFKKSATDKGERYAHQVGTKKSNPWGLYDMLGNVWEWVQDGYLSDSYTITPRTDPLGPPWSSRFVRGGSYNWSAGWVRPSFRNPIGRIDITQDYNVGFRILMIDK